MKIAAISTVLLLSMGVPGAQSSSDFLFPQSAIEQLKRIKVGEVDYRNAQLLEVCEHLSTFLLASHDDGPVSNLTVVASGSAGLRAGPTRVTLTDATASMWDVMTNVCRQADIALRYEDGRVVFETSNTRDILSLSVDARSPLGTTQPEALDSVTQPVELQIYIRSATEENDAGIPVVNADLPIDVLAHLRPHLAERASRDVRASGEIVYRRAAQQGVAIENVVLRKGNAPPITVEMEKQEDAEWKKSTLQAGRWVVTYDEDTFFDRRLGARISVTHIRDPANRLPTGIYRLVLACHLRATIEGVPRDLDLSGSCDFDVREASSSADQYANTWASSYLHAARANLAPSEVHTFEAHLQQIGDRVPPGASPRLDHKLAILAYRAKLDDMAFTRTVEYLKRDEDWSRVMITRVRELAERLGRKDPMPEIHRFRKETAPAEKSKSSPLAD